MEGPNQNSTTFESLSKDDRRNKISEAGILENKRFSLPTNTELREQLPLLRSVTESLREKHPEILGLTIYGSYVKGYANAISDIDGFLFVDEDSIRRVPSEKKPEKLVIDIDHLVEIGGDVNREFESYGLDKKWHGPVGLYLLSKDRIIEACHEGAADPTLMTVFYLAVSQGINVYRELIISTLEQMGEEGERNWEYIMESLWDSEGKGLSPDLLKKRRKLYPKTLSEGRRYFLHEDV